MDVIELYNKKFYDLTSHKTSTIHLIIHHAVLPKKIKFCSKNNLFLGPIFVMIKIHERYYYPLIILDSRYSISKIKWYNSCQPFSEKDNVYEYLLGNVKISSVCNLGDSLLQRYNCTKDNFEILNDTELWLKMWCDMLDHLGIDEYGLKYFRECLSKAFPILHIFHLTSYEVKLGRDKIIPKEQKDIAKRSLQLPKFIYSLRLKIKRKFTK